MDDLDDFDVFDVNLSSDSDDDIIHVGKPIEMPNQRGKDMSLVSEKLAPNDDPIYEDEGSGFRCRYWGCTFNNWDTYTEGGEPVDVPERLRHVYERGIKTRQGHVKVLWLMFNYEVAPDTGTRHLQIVFRFELQILWRTVRSVLGSGHFYRIKTNGDGLTKAIEYHSKEDTADSAIPTHCVEYGQRPEQRQGERTDLANVAAAIVNDRKRLRDFVKDKDICALEVYAKYPSGIKMIEAQADNEWMEGVGYCKPKVYWIYGPSGSGKSKWAHSQADMFVYPDLGGKGGNCWYDSYNGQSKLLIDDIRTDTVTFEKLLKWTDGYKQTLPIKGTHVQLQWKEIYITCPDHYTKVYSGKTGKTDNMYQLTRRLKECYLVLPTGFDDDDEPIPADFDDFIPMKGKPPVSWLKYCMDEGRTDITEWAKRCSWVAPLGDFSGQSN